MSNQMLTTGRLRYILCSVIITIVEMIATLLFSGWNIDRCQGEEGASGNFQRGSGVMRGEACFK